MEEKQSRSEWRRLLLPTSRARTRWLWSPGGWRSCVRCRRRRAPPRSRAVVLRRSRQPSLANLQDAAALLANFNRFSATNLSSAAQVYARSTRLVQEVTADLHHIFKRTRALQKRISENHPAAWASVGERPPFGEDD